MSERRPDARFSIAIKAIGAVAMPREQLGRMVEYYQFKTLVIDSAETESVSRMPNTVQNPTS